MRILLFGADVVNKGAETMIRTVQSEMGKRMVEPPSFFIVLPKYFKATEDQIVSMGINVIERQIPRKMFRNFDIILPIFYLPNLKKEIYKTKQLFWGWRKLMKNFDAVIDIGGYRYGEVWHLHHIMKSLPVVLYAWFQKKPYIFFPQAWGPFTKGTKIFNLCQWMCRKATLLFARDKESQKYLTELLDLSLDRINLVPDIGFRFHPSTDYEDEIEEILINKLRTKNIIGIIPNMKVYERTEGKGKDNYYLNRLIKLSNYLIEEKGFSIILIPHNIDPKENAIDDRFLCDLIYENTAFPSKIHNIDTVVSADYLKTFISKCELIVTSRYHGAVASLELNKPTIIIGWSHKYIELLKEVGLSEYVLDVTFEFDDLINKVEKALNEKEEISKMLKQRVLVLQEKVDGLFDLVSSFLNA